MSDTHAGHGMKVTTDPAGRRNPIREGAGPVTADSLAAESTRAGGGFAQNRDSEPLKVKGANSTFNTTDTSAADVLPPAANAASRSDPDENYIYFGKEQHTLGADSDSGQGHSQERHHDDDEAVSEQQSASTEQKPSVSTKETTPSEQSTGKELSSGHGGGPGTAGKHTGSGPGDGEHAMGKETNSGRGGDEQAGGKAGGKEPGKEAGSGQPEVAPTYVETDVINPPIHAKPKGANLTEGGFDSDDAQNASSNAEIGSEDDPGRVAEAQFQKVMAHSAADSAGSGLKQKGITDDGQYDALPAEEEA